MKRSKHNLSHYRMMTCGMGQLIPIACLEVLPGDTFQHKADALIRMAPLNTPVMHNVDVRVHHFFVANRTIWSDWEDFITGETANPIPTMNSTLDKYSVNAYLGQPPVASAAQISQLPLRAYNAIVNEYYLDQDLQTERTNTDNTIARCAWGKDYFTTARPWTQKGDDVTVPIGDRAPIKGLGASTQSYSTSSGNVYETDGTAATTYAKYLPTDTSNTGIFEEDPDNAGFPNIYADLTDASAIDINELRTAFALQRYQEARARYGSRYTEYLRYLGITPSDARLQRPEFLGGGTTRLNFSEVLQTADGLAATRYGVGDMWGHGIAGLRGNRYRKFFEEHGYVISLMSVRPKAIYQNGIHRSWLRTTKEDYYQKELEFVGQQEITNNEVVLNTTDGTEVFGYTDRYRDYREQPSLVQGDFRDTLNMWHLARSLPQGTTLNSDFVECDPSNRIYQVDDDQSLWCMVNNHCVARRLVSRSAKARVI